MSEQNNNEELELDVNKLMQVRKEKLDELQKAGKNPFEVTKYDIENYSKQIKDNYEEYEQKAGRGIAVGIKIK